MSNIEVFTHGNEIIIWFELLKYAKVWQDWNYGTFEGFLFFMPECQINYFISTINLFYVGEITDSDDIYFPGYL